MNAKESKETEELKEMKEYGDISILETGMNDMNMNMNLTAGSAQDTPCVVTEEKIREVFGGCGKINDVSIRRITTEAVSTYCICIDMFNMNVGNFIYHFLSSVLICIYII